MTARAWLWYGVVIVALLLGTAVLLIMEDSPAYRPAANVIFTLITGLVSVLGLLLAVVAAIAAVVLAVERWARARRRARDLGAPAAPPAPLSLGRKLLVALLWTIAGLMIAIMLFAVVVFVRSSLATGVRLSDSFVFFGFLATWIWALLFLSDMVSAVRTRPLGAPPMAVPSAGAAARPAEPAGQAAASSPRVPTVVSMPLTPAMREALDRARRKRRKAGLVLVGALEAIPLLTLLLGAGAGLAAWSRTGGSLLSLLWPLLLVVGGMSVVIGVPLGGIVAWGDWRWRRLQRSPCLRATGPITITSRTFGSFAFEPQYQMQLVDRVVTPVPGSGLAPMELAWGSVDFTQDKGFVFEVRDEHDRPLTRAPGYASD